MVTKYSVRIPSSGKKKYLLVFANGAFVFPIQASFQLIRAWAVSTLRVHKRAEARATRYLMVRRYMRLNSRPPITLQHPSYQTFCFLLTPYRGENSLSPSMKSRFPYRKQFQYSLNDNLCLLTRLYLHQPHLLTLQNSSTDYRNSRKWISHSLRSHHIASTQHVGQGCIWQLRR